jgi:hypothetical protein
MHDRFIYNLCIPGTPATTQIPGRCGNARAPG